MKLKKYFSAVVLGCSLLMTSCVSVPTQQEMSTMSFGFAPTNYESPIKQYFDSTLIDPYSAHYEFSTPVQFVWKDSFLLGGKVYAGYLVNTQVNSKNRMGGYGGSRRFGFIFNSNRIIKVITPDEYELANN